MLDNTHVLTSLLGGLLLAGLLLRLAR